MKFTLVSKFRIIYFEKIKMLSDDFEIKMELPYIKQNCKKNAILKAPLIIGENCFVGSNVFWHFSLLDFNVKPLSEFVSVVKLYIF
jgi:hypothetical protein